MTEIPLGTESIVDESNEMRERYLERVTARTLGGLGLVFIALVLSFFPIIQSRIAERRVDLCVMVLGGLLVTHVVARRMVRGRVPAAGLVLGSFALGVVFLPDFFNGLFSGTPFAVALTLAILSVFVLAGEGAGVAARWGATPLWSRLQVGVAHAALPLRVGIGVMAWEHGFARPGSFGAEIVLSLRHQLGAILWGGLLMLAVGTLLCTNDRVHRSIPADRPTEAAFELTESLVLFFWALLMFIVHLW